MSRLNCKSNKKDLRWLQDADGIDSVVVDQVVRHFLKTEEKFGYCFDESSCWIEIFTVSCVVFIRDSRPPDGRRGSIEWPTCFSLQSRSVAICALYPFFFLGAVYLLLLIWFRRSPDYYRSSLYLYKLVIFSSLYDANFRNSRQKKKNVFHASCQFANMSINC